MKTMSYTIMHKITKNKRENENSCADMVITRCLRLNCKNGGGAEHTLIAVQRQAKVFDLCMFFVLKLIQHQQQSQSTLW